MRKHGKQIKLFVKLFVTREKLISILYEQEVSTQRAFFIQLMGTARLEVILCTTYHTS